MDMFASTREKVGSGHIFSSETLPGHKNQYTDECHIDQNDPCENHESAFVEERADVGLFDLGEGQEHVFAVAGEGEEGVKRVLVGG